MIWTAGIIIVLLLSAYIYGPLTLLGFCSADDPWMLLLNKYAHPESYSLQYLREVFTRINDIQYSPVNTLVYSLIYRFNAYDPYYFHLFNFCLHMANGIILLLLARRILSAFSIPNAGIIAYLVYMLWCLHPLNVEPVVWVSGSKILICTFLTLVSFYYFVKAFPQNNQHAVLYCILLLQRAGHYNAFYVPAFCGMLSIEKEWDLAGWPKGNLFYRPFHTIFRRIWGFHPVHSK